MATLREIVQRLNNSDDTSDFKLTELSAKRSCQNGNWAIVWFRNSRRDWSDFSRGLVELYEAIPAGYPLSDVAERLGCSVIDLQIIARKSAGKWKSVNAEEEESDEQELFARTRAVADRVLYL